MTNVEIRKERTSMELLEKVLYDKNLFEAYKQVYKKKEQVELMVLLLMNLVIICIYIKRKSRNK